MKWWIVIFLILAVAVILIVLLTPRGNYEPTSFSFVLSQLGYNQDNKNTVPETPKLPVEIINEKPETLNDINNDNNDNNVNNDVNNEIEKIEPDKKEINNQSSSVFQRNDHWTKNDETIPDADVYSRINELINVEELKEEWREMQKEREENGLPRLRLSMAQYICQKTFEEIFAKPFPEVRPEFLTNPETFDPKYPERSRLELDGFNEELMVAFEYNGQQHYEWSEDMRTKFKMSKRDFVQQCRRDIFKKEVCKAMGIILLVIPYKADGKKLKYEDIPLWIANHLDRRLDKYRHDLIYL